MKRILLLAVAVLAASLTACSASGTESEASDGTVVITEKMFSEQVNYIYLNAEKYLGKTIMYEGFVDISERENGEPVYYVIRYGQGGCCGNDGSVGFEIKTDGSYPSYNDWVEVKGTLCSYEDGIYSVLYIDAESLEVLAERGEEYI